MIENRRDQYLAIASFFIFIFIVISVMNFQVTGEVVDETSLDDFEEESGWTLGVILTVVLGVVIFLSIVAWILYRIRE